jgi:polyhydroxyalkanoate synthesis regulator phasin
MKTAENTATDESKSIGEQLTSMFYLGIGICALAKEKMDEVVEEFKARNPETVEKGEKIVNDFVHEARHAAEKLMDDVKKTYSDVRESAADFVEKEKENIKSKMGKKAPGEDEEEGDVWAERDIDEENPDEDDLNEDEADDDDDLDYVNDDDDEADLEDDEFEDEDAQNGKEMKDEYPRQHEASQKDNTASPEVNTPPSNSEMSGSDVDGANGENPTRINPVM